MPPAPGTMVNSILSRVVQFFQDPVNREKIHTQCIDPLLRHILDRMFPYIILTCIIFTLILLMSLTSVGLLMFQLHSMNTSAGMAVPSVVPSLVAAPVPSLVATPILESIISALPQS